MSDGKSFQEDGLLGRVGTMTLVGIDTGFLGAVLAWTVPDLVCKRPKWASTGVILILGRTLQGTSLWVGGIGASARIGEGESVTPGVWRGTKRSG